ncbi:MAG TPA: hypothetical protein VNU48_00900 [Burkholderiaceae bacterium]|nr:hypothetical protein [Burkholderiaceae bacterium]
MNRSGTLPLFDDDEPAKSLSLVEVLAGHKPATKAQQTFHKLVLQIERKREQLAQWQAATLRHDARVAAEMLPLQARLQQRQRDMAVLIDTLLSQPTPGQRRGKVQRAKLRQLLLNLLTGLLEDGDDPTLEALYDKHADVPLAQERQDEMDLAQAMLEDVFGMEVDADHGASTAEELFAHAQRKMHEGARERAHAQQQQREERAAKRGKAGAAKADAAQARREQAAAEVGQSVREVYRKLASALHPDREAEPQARQRKTLLMQRVNQAYDANDLLTLLGLQLEIEQIDAEHLASVPAQRLAHFNQVLREQLAELDTELARCMAPFRAGRGYGPTPTPAAIDQEFNVELAQLRAALREIEADLVAFRDPAQLRAALTHYRLERDDDDALDPADLDELLGALDLPTPAPRPSRRRHKS